MRRTFFSAEAMGAHREGVDLFYVLRVVAKAEPIASASSEGSLVLEGVGSNEVMCSFENATHACCEREERLRAIKTRSYQPGADALTVPEMTP